VFVFVFGGGGGGGAAEAVGGGGEEGGEGRHGCQGRKEVGGGLALLCDAQHFCVALRGMGQASKQARVESAIHP